MASLVQGLIGAVLVLALVTVSYGCINDLQDCTTTMLNGLQEAQESMNEEKACQVTNTALSCFQNLDCGSDFRDRISEVITNTRKQLQDAGCEISGASSLSPLSLLSGLLVVVVGFFVKNGF